MSLGLCCVDTGSLLPRCRFIRSRSIDKCFEPQHVRPDPLKLAQGMIAYTEG